MLIAHLPAGYVLARVLKTRQVMFWGILAGSVLPDFDMLWFHFVDAGGVHHHTYLTHRPFLWVLVLVLGLVIGRAGLAGLGAGGLFHLVLDSIAGRIDWGWPFAQWPVTLVEVPATQDHWVWSFVLHWTFAVELMVVAGAAALLWRARA